MNLFGKILLYIVLALIIAALGLFIYVNTAFPSVGPAPDIKINPTAERLARGEYLFHHVSMCGDCHTTRDWTMFTAPVKEELLASGNFDEFNEELGFPGTFYASNLTPANLGSWTDGEIFRAITTGVNKDGRALFPVMPYKNYGQLDKEDLYSIIAYIRSLKPIERETPISEVNFPMNLILKTIPSEAQLSKRPDKSDVINYGKYMITAASCADCHTPAEKGQALPGMDYAGGFAFNLPTGGVVKSANITPDKETGIGNWSKEQFINCFKSYLDSNFVPEKVKPNEFNTLMPWTKYAGMKEEDLGAIYDYLMTVKPVSNKVEKFTPSN